MLSALHDRQRLPLKLPNQSLRNFAPNKSKLEQPDRFRNSEHSAQETEGWKRREELSNLRGRSRPPRCRARRRWSRSPRTPHRCWTTCAAPPCSTAAARSPNPRRNTTLSQPTSASQNPSSRANQRQEQQKKISEFDPRNSRFKNLSEEASNIEQLTCICIPPPLRSVWEAPAEAAMAASWFPRWGGIDSRGREERGGGRGRHTRGCSCSPTQTPHEHV